MEQGELEHCTEPLVEEVEAAGQGEQLVEVVQLGFVDVVALESRDLSVLQMAVFDVESRQW